MAHAQKRRFRFLARGSYTSGARPETTGLRAGHYRFHRGYPAAAMIANETYLRPTCAPSRPEQIKTRTRSQCFFFFFFYLPPLRAPAVPSPPRDTRGYGEESNCGNDCGTLGANGDRYTDRASARYKWATRDLNGFTRGVYGPILCSAISRIDS